MTLRYYQVDAIQSVYDYFAKREGNPIIAMPTGTGKAVVIAGLLQRIFKDYPTQRILMITHVKELIVQNKDKLLTWWPTAPVGVYSAGVGRWDTDCPITFCGIQSVAKKAELFGHIDLVIVDECHLIGKSESSQYLTFLAKLYRKNPYIKVIGLTATHYRSGMGCLTEGVIFDDVCYDITDRASFARLVREGYLCPLVAKRTAEQLDVTGVAKQGDDYVLKQLQAAVDLDPITQRAVAEIFSYGADRKSWLIFASGIEHAKHITDALIKLGISAVCIYGDMGDEARDDAVLGLKTGKYRAAVNYNVLTTGFDHPSLDLIAVLRPTLSTVLWVQMLGRGTRPAPFKDNCLVLDFAGNTQRLGPIDDPVKPTRPGAKRPGQGAPVRICPDCNTYVHASLVVCPECGYEFPRHIKIDNTATQVSPMSGPVMPLVEVFDVDKVEYRVHHKEGSPDSLQVLYTCGLRRFSEYICFEHPGYARVKARNWWKERSSLPPPESIMEAIHSPPEEEPRSIRVWVNSRHPEILSYEF